MSLNIPDRYIQHMATLQATFDLTRFTSRQLSNIKSYYTSGYVGGESTTKLIARSLWANYAPKNHPHIIVDWTHRVKNYPADHIIWTEYVKVLVLSKLLPDNLEEYSVKHIQASIDRIEEGVKKGEPFSSEIQAWWNKDSDKALSTMVKTFEKKAIVPMPVDNEGLKHIDKIMSGETTRWDVTYVEEAVEGEEKQLVNYIYAC